MASLWRKLGVGIAVALVGAGAARPAHAASIAFATSGTFGSSGTNVLVDGPITITFTGIESTALNEVDSEWWGSFGFFTVTTTGKGSTGGLKLETFTLSIITSLEEQADFSSMLSGQINFNKSNAGLTFDSLLTQQIDTLFYSVVDQDGVLRLLSPSDPASSVEILGHVLRTGGVGGGLAGDSEVLVSDHTVATVPEPGTLLLFGAGAVALTQRRYTQSRRS